MYLHTKKQQKYYNQVIDLYFKGGYGARRITKMLSISHNTVYSWIAIFAEENNISTSARMNKKEQKKAVIAAPSASSTKDEGELQAEIEHLEKELLRAQIKAEFLDEMINVAEAKFNVPIRKKAGAKQ